MTQPPESSIRQRGTWRAGLLALALSSAPALAGPLMLTGQVRALDAEPILMPQSDVAPATLRYLIPEGTQVQPGDVLIRLDPGNSLNNLQELEAQIEQAGARRDKDLAELKVKAIDARIALIQARATRDKAQVDAEIPRDHLSALDFDRYAGEYERARREHDLKRAELAAAQGAVQRRQADAVLEVRKLEAQLAYHRLQVEAAEQRATRAGTVRHGFDSRSGQRYAEGMSAYPGAQVGEVAGNSAMGVRAFALESERAGLREGQPVTLRFDALGDVVARGRIERIAGAPEAKREWGDGRYFEVDVGIDDAALSPRLLSGMSVRVDAEVPDSPAAAQVAP
ncbi:MAG TPA: HlyD family efflux transporter periplasmic adaptor subunit [Chiayiivirga sp.]|nr:HlyD family efflux transporter periplasmic adaptor subunit [Chiayiivirga sp.]